MILGIKSKISLSKIRSFRHKIMDSDTKIICECIEVMKSIGYPKSPEEFSDLKNVIEIFDKHTKSVSEMSRSHIAQKEYFHSFTSSFINKDKD